MPLRKRRYKILVVVLIALFSFRQGTPANAGNNFWTGIGPDSIAVFVKSLVIDPVTPDTLYAVTRGGVFRSTNAAESWTKIDNNLFTHQLYTLPEVSVLVIDPKVHTTLYLMSTDGFYKSANSGETWTKWSTTAEWFTSLVINPLIPATMYGAVAGEEGRLLKSTNGGKDWSEAMIGLSSGEIRALAMDPLVPSTLYIGMYEGGVFKSLDSGSNWSRAPRDNADETNFWDNKKILDVAVDPVEPSTLYVITEQDGLFKSMDGGANWISLAPAYRNPISIAIDPVTHTTLYMNTYDNRLIKSTNSGNDWTLVHQASLANIWRAVKIDPLTPSTLYALTNQGLYKSINGGADWSTANAGLIDAMVLTIAVDPVSPSTLYVGTFKGVFKTTNSGASWAQLIEGFPEESPHVVDHIVIDPHTPTTVYAVSGEVFKSPNGGENWTKMSNGIAEQDWIKDLAIDPQTPTTVYALAHSGTVYKTMNGGKNWTAYSLGLVYGTPFKLVIDPLTPTTLYVGTDGNGVRKSTDGGQTWFQTGLPAYTASGMYALVIDPKTPTTLYADVYIGSDSPKNGIYKSVDGGTNWTQISADIPWVGALGVDPHSPTTLYASVWYRGVLKSTDGGKHWTTLNSGLPYYIINALAVDPHVPGTVYAGTYITGVYKMQNNPLVVNHSSGAPGSYFTLLGSQFTPNSTAAIKVNGHNLGSVPVDSEGRFTFTLQTSPETDEGMYSVIATTPKDQSDARFFIRAGDPVHPREGNVTILIVPDGIANRQLFLPVAAR